MNHRDSDSHSHLSIIKILDGVTNIQKGQNKPPIQKHIIEKKNNNNSSLDMSFNKNEIIGGQGFAIVEERKSQKNKDEFQFLKNNEQEGYEDDDDEDVRFLWKPKTKNGHPPNHASNYEA